MSDHPTKLHPFGFAQLDPVPDDATLSEFYESRYYDLIRQGGRAPELQKLLDTQGERPAELAWLQATQYEDVADAIRPHVRPEGEVLDVGCGAGDLVHYLSAKGFRASGIEPSADAVAVAVSRGAEAHVATLERWSANPENVGRYDAVTLMNVLEHVPDPVGALTHLRTLLSPAGVVTFRVPNDFTALQEVAEATGVQRKRWWVAVPDHINYFQESSARATCAAVGLEVVDVLVDFPMEFFILMGINYIDDPAAGKQAHALRKAFELNLPKAMRQSLYRALAAQGMGRNLLVTARRA
jgi:2-polyprenyl-3-methyl-5-hydroxy-6-metoxy-1,4-benzoquinol methylase